jgi:hypothetical protein
MLRFIRDIMDVDDFFGNMKKVDSIVLKIFGFCLGCRFNVEEIIEFEFSQGLIFKRF